MKHFNLCLVTKPCIIVQNVHVNSKKVITWCVEIVVHSNNTYRDCLILYEWIPVVFLSFKGTMKWIILISNIVTFCTVNNKMSIISSQSYVTIFQYKKRFICILTGPYVSKNRIPNWNVTGHITHVESSVWEGGDFITLPNLLSISHNTMLNYQCEQRHILGSHKCHLSKLNYISYIGWYLICNNINMFVIHIIHKEITNIRHAINDSLKLDPEFTAISQVSH